MVSLIETIPWPVVHYKIFAGGNIPIEDSWSFAAQHVRSSDLICIGHYLGDNPNMIVENVATTRQRRTNHWMICKSVALKSVHNKA